MATAKKQVLDQRESSTEVERDPIKDSSFGRRKTTRDKKIEEGMKKVRVSVARGFNFTLPDHTMIRYEPGDQEMPISHAEDSFAQGMGGVTINK